MIKIFYRLIVFASLLISVTRGYTQTKSQEIIIKVNSIDSINKSLASFYQNGFLERVEGQQIEYHSSHPDAERALLVRARQDVSYIAWKSDTLKETYKNYYNLIWLAGIEKSGWQQNTPHRFEFFINGELWFTFKNLKDSSAQNWTIHGKNESELSFTSTMTDRFGDLFGYMTLKLPKKYFTVNQQLLFEVKGEDANSPDWYMTFEYSFNFTPRLRLEPAILRTPNGQAQILRLSLDNLINGRSIQIISPLQDTINRSLNVGGNIFFIPIEEVKTETDVPITFMIDENVVEKKSFKIKPVVKREIHLLSYSHNDIGYTDLQPNIEKKQIKNLEDALELIEKTKFYPREAQYKWNLEVIWALESFMNYASNEKKKEVLDAVKDGKLGLNALYANVLTGLASGEEMMHFTDYARKFSKEFNVPITTACISDIPGFTWGIVNTLAQSGVKYFSIAPNNGDRVGYIYELGDKPFYWKSQSGEEKILTWIAASSYSSFHEGDLSSLGDEKILKMMRRLDENNYPYDIVKLPYTIGGDNGPPDRALSDFVKKWNEKYISPRLIISTHEQMFKEFEKRYGQSLPILSGDLTPYWEDGAFSTARETFLNRHAADRLIQNEILWSLCSPEKFPVSEFENAWRQVVLYDEHTWGAHNSITDPDSSFVIKQWEIKKQFALTADSVSKALLLKVFSEKNKNDSVIYIYNTTSWQRTDLILLSSEQSRAGDLIIDENMKKIPSQRLSTGELAFVAENIPPLSSKKYFLRKDKAFSKGKSNVYGTTIENEFISATVSNVDGTIKEFIWKKIGQNLVNNNGGLNHYFYVRGNNPDSAFNLKNVRIKIKERGPIVASLIVEADAVGCRSYSTEIRIIDGIERVDIINNLDKIAIRDKEGIHFCFPFNIPNGKLKYDVAWGIVEPEKDQLPGSCKNFFSVQSFVDISNSKIGVTWATPDASMIEIGAINAEKPWMKTIEPSQTFYSYVMNNYWHTNYKADQEGPVTICYSIQPHYKFKSHNAIKFGLGNREPLIISTSDCESKTNNSLFTLEPQEILLTYCKPFNGGRHIRLYNASNQTQKVKINWKKEINVSIFQSDASGNIIIEQNNNFSLLPYGVHYLFIKKN